MMQVSILFGKLGRILTLTAFLALTYPLDLQAAEAESSKMSEYGAKVSETIDKTNINRPVKDKWALIVGISEFQDSSIPRLKYASKDARDFYDYLIKEANFSADHVRILLDKDATQRRILSELGSKYLARMVQPDDLVVLFFSTHGSPSQLDIRGKNYIVAYDSDPKDLFSSGIEMQRVLESIKGRVLTDRVLMFLDACHSGNVDPNAKGIYRAGNFDAEVLAQGSGQLVICSSTPDQRSWESKRYDNGVFTKQMLSALRKKGGKANLGEAFEDASQLVQQEVKEDYPGMRQTPVLHSKWSGENLLIGIKPAQPRPVPETVLRELSPDSSSPTTMNELGGRFAVSKSSSSNYRKHAEDTDNDRITIETLRSKERIVLTQTSFWDGPNPNKAYEQACKTLSTNFNNPEYYYKKAIILIRLGKYGKAMQTLKDIITEKGNDYRFYLAIGYCFHKMGQEGRALDNLEKAKFHNPLLPKEIVFGD